MMMPQHSHVGHGTTCIVLCARSPHYTVVMPLAHLHHLCAQNANTSLWQLQLQLQLQWQLQSQPQPQPRLEPQPRPQPQPSP